MKVSTNLKAGATAIAVGAANVSIIDQSNTANNNIFSTITQTNSATVTQTATNSGAITAAAVSTSSS